jgi:hypothetical protein
VNESSVIKVQFQTNIVTHGQLKENLYICDGKKKRICKSIIWRIPAKIQVTRTWLNIGGKLRCYGMVSNSCSTSGTRRVNLVTKPVISHEWGKDREVLTTSSAGFTNRLDRLKSRASKFRRPPANLYNTFDTVIELSYLCGPSALYSLNNPSVIFCTVALHFRIL